MEKMYFNFNDVTPSVCETMEYLIDQQSAVVVFVTRFYSYPPALIHHFWLSRFFSIRLAVVRVSILAFDDFGVTLFLVAAFRSGLCVDPVPIES